MGLTPTLETGLSFFNFLKKSALIRPIRLIRGAYSRWSLQRAGRELGVGLIWFLLWIDPGRKILKTRKILPS